MLSLDKYLDTDPIVHKFSLPVSTLSKIKLQFYKIVLGLLPFKRKIFVDSGYGLNLYFEVILNYLKKEFGVSYSTGYLSVFGKNLVYQANIRSSKTKGHGSDFLSKEVALSKAIGEFLERASTSVPSNMDLKDVLYRDYKYVHEQLVTVRNFHDFSDSQYCNVNNLKINEDTKIALLPVLNLVNNTRSYYPVQQIFWEETIESKGEGIIGYITTSGCAGGFSREHAKLNAIYEAVERDSFFCYWQTKSTPDKLILTKNFSSKHDKLQQILDDMGFKMEILDTTTNLGLPSCLCVVYGADNKQLCVSGGCRANMAEAVDVAVAEMFSCLPTLATVKDFDLPTDYKPFLTKNMGRHQRLNYWAHLEDLKEIDFLLRGVGRSIEVFESRLFQTKHDELDFVVRKFKELGDGHDNIFIYETKNVALEKLGFFVVRAITPKLYPLYLVEHLAFTKSTRLVEFNFWRNGVRDFTFNTSLHPFP